MTASDTTAMSSVEYAASLLADMGGDVVEGHDADLELDFNLAWPAPNIYGHGQQEIDGVYLTVYLPSSLMADLLLESHDHVVHDVASDPLGPFRWSGTSEEWVLERLSGPLLEMLGRQNQARRVSLTDELLRVGPLPREVGPAAKEIAAILSAVRAHFDLHDY